LRDKRRRRRLALGAGAALGATAFAAPAADAATYTVTSNGDAGVAGELRLAIEAANATPGVEDDIVFDSSVTGQIGLLDQLVITDAVHIHGPGARVLTVSGQTSHRVFDIDFTTVRREARGALSNDVTFSGLTISGGSAAFGAGIRSYGADVNVVSSTVTGNTITVDNITDGSGAGIAIVDFSLDVYDSTISGNSIVYQDMSARGGTPYAGFGGGIYTTSSGDVYVVNSTVSGNAAAFGGGIAAEVDGNLVAIANSTIANNAALGFGGGVYAKYEGVTRGLGGDVELLSTIVGDNFSPNDPDLSDGVGSAEFAAGWSLIENGSGATVNEFGPNIIGQDPQLGDLLNNGGPTDTHLPAATGPGLDKGITPQAIPRGFELTTDQRGQPRTQDDPAIANATPGDGTDIGSVELSQTSEPGPETRPAPLTVRQCLGETATIVGTTGKDVIVGTDGRDVIRGLRGNDVIKSVGGNDLVCGDKGRDKIRTGDGNDTARGGNNGDSMRGGDGDDLLRGGSGLDRILGEDGDDQLFGGAPRGKRGGGGGGGPGNVCDGGAGTDAAEGCETVRDVP
jgi:Ca2+-binding RTX toxin-like protein